MIYPNFLYIGPDKAGSTWIYNYLKIHPNAYVPDTKELFFFDKYYDRGWEWYVSHFKDANNAKAVGEISHDYLFSKTAAKRIKYNLGNVILLCSLRNPIERSVSQYLHMYRVGIVDLDVENGIYKYPGILCNSFYKKNIRIFEKLFTKYQIQILDFDLLKTNPKKYATDLCNYLEIEKYYDDKLGQKVNPALLPKSNLLSNIGKKTAQFMRDKDLSNLLTRIKYNKITSTVFFKKLDNETKSIVKNKIKEISHFDLYGEVQYFKKEYGINFEKWLIQNEE